MKGNNEDNEEEKERVYLCDDCAGNVYENKYSEFSHCNDCGKVYNDSSFELWNKYKQYEVIEE